MSNKEFSEEFDILYNNIASNQAPGLDEYEKSVFLTKAQEEVIKSAYSSFENTEDIRRYLSELVNTSTINTSEVGELGTINKSSRVFKLPSGEKNTPKVWFITYEFITLKGETSECLKDKEISVIPVTQDEYSNIIDNPFKGPNDRRAIRLDINDNKVEIISKYKDYSYTLRYISKPSPIILEDLDLGLSIDDITQKTECKLNPVIHRIILDKAVQLAALAYKQ